MSRAAVWAFRENASKGYYFLKHIELNRRILSMEEAEKDHSWWSEKTGRNEVYAHQVGEMVLLTEEVAAKSKISLPPGCYVYRPSESMLPERLEVIDTRKDQFLPLRKSLENVRLDLENFLSSRELYDELRMDYRRGYLFYGPPGNGKTAQIRDLARTVLKDNIVVWLSRLPSIEMRAALNNSPLMKAFVIEEVTSQNESAYEMRNLLDFFDGETSPTNSIIFGTTNYPQFLATNLADRPSRFDVVAEIPNLSPTEAHAYAEAFLKRKVTFEEMKWVGMSVAHVKEIVLRHRKDGKSLQAAYDEMAEHRKKLKEGFPEKEQKKGMGLGATDSLASELADLQRSLEQGRSFPEGLTDFQKAVYEKTGLLPDRKNK